jgi:peptidoglycan/LPS O-acetylase OafA/YrhL
MKAEQSKPTRPAGYMHQLDGVRAIAVISVIIFHLNPNWLPGGYLGVDVFFLLSGFLITRLLYRDFNAGDYSWTKFIARRIRRLMPALMVMISVVMIAGIFLLVFPNREQLIPQGFAAIFSYSNYFYYHTTSGYWGSHANSIALLHTWSLAVEEQFYLIFPLIFYSVFKISPKSCRMALPVFSLLAFVCYLFAYSDDPSVAFYYLHARAWQLLLGGSLALWAPQREKTCPNSGLRPYLAWSSLITLCSCFYYLDHEAVSASNGWALIIPSLSATCLIWLASSGALSLKFLATRPLTYIGQISYSLYLWHWPIIVMSKFITPDPHPVTLILLTVIAACMSYHLIEKPFRYSKASTTKILFGSLALPCISIILLTLTKQNPIVPNELKPMMDAETIQDRKQWKVSKKKVSPLWGHQPNESKDTPVVMINGSSHARVLCGALNEYAQIYNYRFGTLSIASGGVTQTSIKKGQDRARTNKIRNKIIQDIHPDILFIAGYWQSELSDTGKTFNDRLRELLISYSKSAKWVIVVGQSPRLEVPDEVGYSIRRHYWSQYLQSEKGRVEIRADDSADNSNAIVKNIVDSLSVDNVIYEDPRHVFYQNEQFTPIRDGHFLYSDRHHINDHSARLIIQNIWERHAKKLTATN